jgi:hypothetical protein
VSGEEPRAHEDALSAKGQRGGEAAPVRDPASCHDHDIIVTFSYGIDHCWDERQG